MYITYYAADENMGDIMKVCDQFRALGFRPAHRRIYPEHIINVCTGCHGNSSKTDDFSREEEIQDFL